MAEIRGNGSRPKIYWRNKAVLKRR